MPSKAVLIIDSLDDCSIIYSNRLKLSGQAGIYCFLNKISTKRYIESAKNLYLRLTEHLSGKKSNSALQLAFVKYGLKNFSYIVYEYKIYTTKALSHKLLTDLETVYIQSFPFERLYNFMQTATSLQGDNYLFEAKTKMTARFKDKTSHPFYKKNHLEETKKLISKKAELNPMFGKKHSLKPKNLISSRLSSYSLGVNVYDSTDLFIGQFTSNTSIAKALNICKSTVRRHLQKGKLYLREI